jgi:hypothetical protein
MDGRQTLIVRKGGISEGPGGFRPDHGLFWLYPTHVHQAEQGLRPEARSGLEGPPPAPTDPVPIQALAAVGLIHRVESEESLRALDGFHVWTQETIRKRFDYRQPGLWVLGVRVFRRDEPWTLVPTPEQLGCKSWAVLETPLSTEGLRPVLEEDDWAERLRSLRSLLPGEPGGSAEC